MSQLLARYLLMSDAHWWMVVPPEKQKGIVVKGWDRLWDWLIFRKQKKLNNQNFRITLLKIYDLKMSGEIGHLDGLIFTGDLIECVYNERGIVTSVDVEEITMLKNFMLYSVRIEPESAHFISGDHELGYQLPVKVDPGGGMRLASLENFRKILGPLFDAWRNGDFHFITVSSSLFIQSTDHLEDKERKEIESLKHEQEIFLTEYLLNVPAGQKVFLFLHDADAIEVIDQFPGADKITKVICGHFHRERNFRGYRTVGKLAKSFWGRLLLRAFWGLQNRFDRANRIIAWAEGNLHRFELFEKYDLLYIPSVAETKSFFVLELYESGNYEILKLES